MSNIRGMALAAAVKYIKQTYGEEGFKKVVEAMEAGDREVMAGSLNPVNLYSMKAYNSFLDKADKLLGKGDYELCRQVGIFEARETFTGLYKVFLEVGNPHFVIKKAGLAWRTLHDAGDLEVEQTGDKYVRGKVSNFPDPHKAFCWDLVGYFEKVLEMSGAKNLDVKEIKCRCSGDDCCEFEVRWE